MDSIAKFINFKNIVMAIAVFLVIFGVLAFSGKIPIFKTSSQDQLTGNVVIWGTLPQSAMDIFVQNFNKQAKTYTMTYTEVPENQINQKLLIALADGTQPDLVLAPANIAFANQQRILYVSPKTISETSFQNSFVDEASILINMPNGYLALPISVDPLILYYNKDILASNGFFNPPSTWSDLYKYDDKISKSDSAGNISLSTIAFGTYDNIPNITDIVLSMILQQGQVPVSEYLGKDSLGNYAPKYTVNLNTPLPNSTVAPLNSTLNFMKDFADPQKPTYDWSPLQNNAQQEFISGNLAFYIGFASEANYIKSANQKLNFDYKILPQVEGSKVSATYGKLYTIFMLAKSPSPQLAYTVLQNLATGQFSQTLVSLTGGVSALKANLATAIASGDHSALVFGNSAMISKTFYDLHRDSLESLMKQAINQIYNGEKTTVEASQDLVTNLQAVYDNN